MTNKEYLKALFEFVNANDYKTTDTIEQIIDKVENGEEYSITSTKSTEVRPERVNASYYITVSNDEKGNIEANTAGSELTENDYELLVSSSFNNEVFLSNCSQADGTTTLKAVKGSYDIDVAINVVGRALGVVFKEPREVWEYVKTEFLNDDVNDRIFYNDNTVSVYFDPLANKTYLPYDFVLKVLYALKKGEFLNVTDTNKQPSSATASSKVSNILVSQALGLNAGQPNQKFKGTAPATTFDGVSTDEAYSADVCGKIGRRILALAYEKFGEYGLVNQNLINAHIKTVNFVKNQIISGLQVDYAVVATIDLCYADSFKFLDDTSWTNPFPVLSPYVNEYRGFTYFNEDGSNVLNLTSVQVRIEIKKTLVNLNLRWRATENIDVYIGGNNGRVKETTSTDAKYGSPGTLFTNVKLASADKTDDNAIVITDESQAAFLEWGNNQVQLQFYNTERQSYTLISIFPASFSASTQSDVQSGDSEDDRGVGGNEGSLDDGTTIPPGNADADDGTTGSGVDSIAVPGFVNAYYCTDANLVELSRWFYETDWNSLGNLILDANPLENIIAIKKVPFQPETSSLANIKVGTLTSDDLAPTIIDRLTKINCGKITVKPYFNDLRDYFPYTQASIYLPFVGVINLNINDIMDSTVEVEYSVDVLTGEGIASIIVERNSMRAVLYTANCNLAIDVPLTSSNAARMLTKAAVAAVAAVGVGAVVGVGGAASSLAGSALSSPAKMITSADAIDAVSVGVESGIQSTSDTLSKVGTSNITTMNRSGEMSGITGWMGVMTPYIIINRAVKSEPYGYEEIEGVASNHTVKLNNCKGFTRVKSIHLENMGNATATEIAQIEEALKHGVIF